MSEKGKQPSITRRKWENVYNPKQVSPQFRALEIAKYLGGEKFAIPIQQAVGGIKSEAVATDLMVALGIAFHLRPWIPTSGRTAFDMAKAEKAATDFIAEREKMHNLDMADRRLLVTELAARLSGVTLERAVQLTG